jgi:UDP-N-acetylglucosamine--N-acetylmuramyl-(pentapeptide) pyrophosphoryl-undecaprenol N-acetylglucosamine transferase
MSPKKIIFSGGGTAGHLYPGLAVSRKIIDREPGTKITFVGGSRALEKTIMDRHGVHFIPLKIEGLKGKGKKIFKSLLLLPTAFLKSFFLLLRIKPHLVVGLGGYSSGPIVLLASWMRIPTVILEQNLFPGFTNKALLRWVKKAVVAFEGSLPSFKGKGVFLGNPAREEFYTLQPKTGNDGLTLLIFGGSQGSRFLNTQITKALPLIKNHGDKLHIFHQTGRNDYEWVQEAYQKSGIPEATVSPYFHEMARRFQEADLVICRAGATTLAELVASQKAAILVPFAQATDSHQVLNAQELVRIEGAEMILEDDFQPEIFAEKITHYLNNKDGLSIMENNLKQLKIENSADRIADLCWQLLDSTKKERRS